MDQDIKTCLAYIDRYWDKITFKPQQKEVHHHIIDIPYPYITPNHTRFNYIFYWDTYFMFRGLMGTRREWLMKNMVDNFTYIFDQYGIIPNFNSPASTGRSQPPFFSSMILDTYKTFNNGNNTQSKFAIARNLFIKPHKLFGFTHWLKNRMETAEKEYTYVWNVEPGTDIGFYHRVLGYGLNRYGDRDNGFAHSSELESGWDMTSRFYNRCNDFLPVDLNCYLYKYETDFVLVANLFGDRKKHDFWEEKAKMRQKEIKNLMWDEDEGFFFDYDYTHKVRSSFFSLAGFMPLWAGIATESQAKRALKNLWRFETKHGLTIDDKESLAPRTRLSKFPKSYRPAIRDIITPKQWDYPNSWPPLEYMTVIGLLKYGLIDDATRIMRKFITIHTKLFLKYGTFFEKINGVTGDRQKGFHYPNQSGFGWTNAIYYRYVQILKAIPGPDGIYGILKEETPPYELTILH